MGSWSERLAVACFLATVPAIVAGCPFDLDDGEAAVVVLTSQGKVAAFDGDGNASIWDATVGSSEFGDLLADGGTVFVLTGGSNVVALDDVDGATIWDTDLGGSTAGELAISDDTLFAQTADDVIALDADSGEILWQETVDDLSGAMATGEGGLFLGGDPVRRLDPASGAEEATFDIGDPLVPALAVSGGRVVVGGRFEVISLFPGDLAEDWSFVLDNASCSGMVADGGDVYVSTDNKGLLGFEADIADPFMEALVTSALDPPELADGTVYVSESFGDVYAIDAETGDEIWPWSSASEHRGGLAYSGGTVFVSDGESLVGIDAADGAMDWEQSPGGTLVSLAAL